MTTSSRDSKPGSRRRAIRSFAWALAAGAAAGYLVLTLVGGSSAASAADGSGDEGAADIAGEAESGESPSDTARGLAERIPAGMRAISVEVHGLGGLLELVQPGTTADLILDRSVPEGAGTAAADRPTEILLENVKILQAASPSSLVLLVTLDEAERLAGAAPRGRLTVTFRNPSDMESVARPVERTERGDAPPAPDPVREIEIYRGGERTTVTVPATPGGGGQEDMR